MAEGIIKPVAQGAVYPSLADLTAGESVRIVEVRVHEPEQLRYLGSLDLYPGARVEVVETAPFDGPISLTVNGAPCVLSRSLAQQLYVADEGSSTADEALP